MTQATWTKSKVVEISELATVSKVRAVTALGVPLPPRNERERKRAWKVFPVRKEDEKNRMQMHCQLRPRLDAEVWAPGNLRQRSRKCYLATNKRTTMTVKVLEEGEGFRGPLKILALEKRDVRSSGDGVMNQGIGRHRPRTVLSINVSRCIGVSNG